ncbi:putative MFS family arabinose efflux permease [Motilibacter rhizosphaerae]|uniref:Putative MFS family arabinose efflux permease n=1 Tax=Motilibacter rhizosphaerae TaxID=598652 RepID=A0A4Q7NRU3_9ACTN|nr:MFS transporter [Motilibacter rhizosphaerae]RZS89634.1 putative MFS family arabinose efflux permease [Motilibacter rhizosphaerae]
MCAACGVPTHVPTLTPPEPAPVALGAQPGPRTAGEQRTGPAKFAALRNKDCRTYLVGGMLSMMADNIEHVITYWVLWQRFHAPALAGFAVIAHWVPFLLLSVTFGGLADRYDCRRVIQVAQLLFMAVSVGWGLFFLTDSLTVPAACVLLVVHGLAGALWGPAEQLMLHDFVGDEALPSAVRLNATARSLGVLFGPVVGAALLQGLHPTAGIFTNVLIYLPLTIFLARTRFTGHSRAGEAARPRLTVAGALRVLREVGDDPVIVSQIILGGLGSFFVGASLQSAMPIFAADDHGWFSADTAYSVLLFATGAGGVVGGLLLEVTGRLRPTVRTAVASTAVYGAAMLGFAVTRNLLLSVVLLLVGGVANLASMSIGQTIVQLRAPEGKRGQVIGVYGMSANGLRAGSGFTVGLLGSAIGVHWSLGLSAAALLVGTGLTLLYVLRSAGSEQVG